MAEFDYKQRPFSSRLTSEEYDRAVGRIRSIPRHPPMALHAEDDLIPPVPAVKITDVFEYPQPGLAPENDPDRGF